MNPQQRSQLPPALLLWVHPDLPIQLQSLTYPLLEILTPDKPSLTLAPPTDVCEFDPSKVQISFPLQDLKQIKEDLSKFSDDPDRYREAFQNFTQIFELSWRDMCYLESDPDGH
ncbi:hypothetical protein AAY473_030001 [Plecturocebus cupreus]